MFKALRFRLSAVYVSVFCVSVISLGFVISVITQNHLMEQLRAHIESNRSQLIGDYLEDGLPELRHDIQERVESEDPDRLWYALAPPDGKIEFDPIPNITEEGWHEVESGSHRLLVLVIPIDDGYRFMVGSSLDHLIAGKKAVQKAFLWAIAATLIIGVISGALVSRNFLGRVERLKKGTTLFGAGDLKYRIPLKNNEDEFDQLSVSLNAMFARIETLVSEVQRVTSNIAHDMRTPLGRVKQKLEGVQQHSDISPVVKKELDEVTETVDGMLETFTALMRIAEIELGTRRSEFRLFKVSEIFNVVADAYEAVVEESGRHILFRSDPETKIFGDKVLLIQLFVNLIENAIQHTPPDTKITFESRGLNAQRVQILVSDNGPGIPASERALVTKPFYKIDRSRGFQGGSGLGLSLVSAVTQLHEATMNIEDNQPGLLMKFIFSNQPRA